MTVATPLNAQLAGPRPAAPRARVGQPRAIADDRMDASLFLLIPALLTNVWYWQLVIPGLAGLKLGLLTVVAAAIAFAAGGGGASALGDPARLPIRLVVGLGALAVVGGPFAIVRGTALSFVIYDVIPTFTLMFLVAMRTRSEYAIRVVLTTIVLGGVVYAYSFVRAPLDSAGKPYGMPYYDANDGALMALCCAVLAIGRASLAPSRLGRYGFALLGMLYLYLVVRSNSRGAFVALVATALVTLLAATSVPMRRRLGVAAAGLVLMTVLGSGSYWANMKTLLEPEKDYNWSGQSETGRMEMWKRGMGYMLEEPFLGSGARNYGNKEGRSDLARRQQALGRGSSWRVAHNAFVEVGVEIGIPGLLCFAGAIIVAFRLLIGAVRRGTAPPRLRPFLDTLWAALLAFSVGSFFVSSQYWTFLYVLLALATSAVVVMRRPAGAPAAQVAVTRARPPVARRGGPPLVPVRS